MTKGWRVVYISKPSRLSVKDFRLVIAQEQSVSLPLEDIACIVLENLQCTLTAVCLSCFAEYNIAVFSCDDKHIPNGVFLPYQNHSQQLAVQQNQLQWSEPFKKRCRQLIVKQKIHNQAVILEHIDPAGAKKLFALSEEVKSGDSDNREGQAARIYFQLTLKDGRRNKSFSSRSLDYGYAVIRGAVARAVAAYGFIPSLGLFHHNELNQFNLADDLMEPFRPWVDRIVFLEMQKKNVAELSLEDKLLLVDVLSRDVVINEEKNVFLNAVDLFVMSLRRCGELGDWKQLALPELKG